ncbi:MAG: cell wall metabolism sensor histidine kinase WalK [Euryarchaeota archaeon]|nr:cell wall metabolism sensor histidine kinase WalK [Euryarchaeota archaeon]
MKVGIQLAFVFIVMIVVIIGAIAVVSIQRESTTFKEELKKQGLILANTLAVESKEAFITDKFVHVMDYIDTVSEQEYVVYVMVRDKKGKVKAHSELNKVGKVITDPALNVIHSSKPYIETSQSSEGELMYNLAVPVTVNGEIVGVAQIGYSLRSLEISEAKARNQIIALTIGGIIVGIFFAFLFSKPLVKPINELKNAANEIAEGNLDTKIDIKSKDEIGELAASFNKMTQDLRVSRDDIISAKKYTDNIVRSIPDTLLVVSPDGIIQTVNPATSTLLGYKEKELIGEPVSNVVAEGKEIPINFSTCIKNVEKTYLAKDGRKIPMLFSGSVMRDDNGNIQGIVCVAQDITEHKKAEKIYLENERLAYASKAKSEFLANMSHELRTPLNSILGFSQLLKQKMFGELNEKQEHHVDNILTSGNFLLNLVNDILDLSKVEAGKMELVIEKIHVPQVMNESLILIKEKAIKHNVKLKLDLDPKLDYIEADKLRIKQVLFNLLGNAVKFSKPEGETVTVTTKKEGDIAKISVSDTGIGIREEDMRKLFNTFEQLDSGITKKYGGTGLGLAISKKLVEMHGGTIMAESKFGIGSTFSFLLPIKAKKEGK